MTWALKLKKMRARYVMNLFRINVGFLSSAEMFSDADSVTET